jgi:hypothetical protein
MLCLLWWKLFHMQKMSEDIEYKEINKFDVGGTEMQRSILFR